MAVLLTPGPAPSDFDRIDRFDGLDRIEFWFERRAIRPRRVLFLCQRLPVWHLRWRVPELSDIGKPMSQHSQTAQSCSKFWKFKFLNDPFYFRTNNSTKQGSWPVRLSDMFLGSFLDILVEVSCQNSENQFFWWFSPQAVALSQPRRWLLRAATQGVPPRSGLSNFSVDHFNRWKLKAQFEHIYYSCCPREETSF